MDIPIWAGTRPYQALPFQWSCHIERAPGAIEHTEFLDLSGEAPMRPLAEAMIEALEQEGPVLMYTSYERGVIRDLADMFPDLAGALLAIDGRLVDLEAIDAETSAKRKEEIRKNLLKYCKHDTKAMVRLVDFFQRH